MIVDEIIAEMEAAARVRKALSRLAAARAAHQQDPGTEAHRHCLSLATYHAEAADSLRRQACELRRDSEPRTQGKIAEEAA